MISENAYSAPMRGILFCLFRFPFMANLLPLVNRSVGPKGLTHCQQQRKVYTLYAVNFQ